MAHISIHRRCRRVAALLALVWAPAFAADPEASLRLLDQSGDGEALAAEVARCTEALANAPHAAAPWRTRRGHAQFRMGSFELAIADYDAALADDDRQDEAWFGRGMARGRNGDIEGGIADLGTYIARHPQSSLAHTKRGVRHLWQGDYAHARADLERAVALDPANAEAHDDLGVVYAQARDYPQAAAHFRAAIRHDASYQKAYHNLALALYLLDEDAAALTAVDAGLALDPDNRNSLLLRGEILDALGRPEEARAARSVAELLPEGNWSETVPLR